jgi:hypothetical protein
MTPSMPFDGLTRPTALQPSRRAAAPTRRAPPQVRKWTGLTSARPSPLPPPRLEHCHAAAELFYPQPSLSCRTARSSAIFIGLAQLQGRSGYRRRGPALTHRTIHFPLGNSSLRLSPADALSPIQKRGSMRGLCLLMRERGCVRERVKMRSQRDRCKTNAGDASRIALADVHKNHTHVQHAGCTFAFARWS